MRNPANLAVPGLCTMTTRTTNGHALRSKGYTLAGCLEMTRRASFNPLVETVTIHTDECDRLFTRMEPGAPLIETTNTTT